MYRQCRAKKICEICDWHLSQVIAEERCVVSVEKERHLAEKANSKNRVEIAGTGKGKAYVLCIRTCTSTRTC